MRICKKKLSSIVSLITNASKNFWYRNLIIFIFSSMIWKPLMKTTKIKMTMSTQFYKHQLPSDLFKYKIKKYFLERFWIWFSPEIKSLSFPYCKVVEPEQTYFFAHNTLLVTKIWTIAWYHKHSHNAATY